MAEVQVKICGLTRRSDAEVAVQAGAAYLGAVFAPRSPRRISPREAAALGRGLDAGLVCVFVNARVSEVVGAASAAGARVLQLHGNERPEKVAALKESGSWRVWKAVRLREPAELLRAVERYGGIVDGILVEGWHPRLEGGAGVRFAWARVAELRGAVPPGLDLIVAGGLDPGNVAEAIELLRPQVVDVSSGVESAPGRKDPELVRRFVAAVRGARVRVS